MALSGTVAFRPDVEEITTEAFERCGIDRSDSHWWTGCFC
jgi:hypothetical protein